MALESLRAELPGDGLFAQQDWLLSPEPFPLEPEVVREIEALGHRLHRFQRACDTFHRRSHNRTLPPWVAGCCDAGKPRDLIEWGRSRPVRLSLPAVIRPDLLLTDHGLVVTEIDSVPGGIGLTAWLNQVYARRSIHPVIGGASGMLDGFGAILPRGADIVVSNESRAYRPEMEWLAAQLNARAESARTSNGRGRFEVFPAESYEPRSGRDVYRFFELFDIPNIPPAKPLLEAMARGEITMTPPPKPWLEEKLWMALFRMRPLRDAWRRELSDRLFRRFERLFPYTWLMDPAPLAPHAVIPRLEVQNWREVERFSQKERELVLKLSGFHEKAWGARSVTVGHDVAHPDWAAAIGHALASFPADPYVLQEFHRARVVEHPFFDPVSGERRIMHGRVRLCPYYFVVGRAVSLGGVLATICPQDKKILHGMKDAILAPCRVA
jgi:hypothetical protein